MADLPEKPYSTFPLTAHRSGQWKKRIGKKDHYFGRWYDGEKGAREGSLQQVDPLGRMWRAALADYDLFRRRQLDSDVLATKSRNATIELVAAAFLTAEHDKLDSGDLKPRSYDNHRTAIKDFLDGIGRHITIRELEEDPALGILRGYLGKLRARVAADTYNRQVRSLRKMFLWSINDTDGVLTGPLRLRGALTLVPIRVRRREQREARAASGGKRMSDIPELRGLCDASYPRLRAAYLLGYFGAYGQGDCAELPIDLVRTSLPAYLGIPKGWGLIHFPRPKSGIDRACIIPPLVVSALQEVIANRPKPASPEYAHLVFLTDEGMPVCYDVQHRDEEGTVQKVTHVDNVKQWHARNLKRLRVCEKCGIVQKKKFVRDKVKQAKCPTCGKKTEPIRRLRFYDLRHAAITLTAGCDETARLLHEGHTLPGVRPDYVEGVHSHSLLKVAQTLLDHWERNEVTPLVGGVGLGFPSGGGEASKAS